MKPSHAFSHWFVQSLQPVDHVRALAAFHPWRFASMLGIAMVLALGLGTSAFAADIKVLTAGAYKPVMLTLQADFEKQTGHRLLITNDTAGALQKRIAGGEAFDVAVLTPATLAPLQTAGKLAGSAVPLARVGIGVAVKRGAPLPDISTVAAFQAALLAAPKLATIDPNAGGSSGIYLWAWFEKMGIAAQLRPKTILVPGGLVAERLVSGQADLALQQASELYVVEGATVVGLIPAEIQNYTVYSGVVSAASQSPSAARALVDWLAAHAAASALPAQGMLSP